MSYLNQDKLVSVLKFKELLSFLEKNSQLIPNTTFGTIEEREPSPLTEYNIHCIPMDLKQFVVSKSYEFENKNFKISLPEGEVDFQLITSLIPEVSLDQSTGTASFRINETISALDDYIDSNDIIDSSLGKVEKDISPFRLVTLPTIIFADQSINLNSFTNSEALEIVKLLHLFRTEVKHDDTRIFKLQKQEDPNERNYTFSEVADEEDEVLKPYLSVKVKYSTVVEYLVRMSAVRMNQLKPFIGGYREVLSEFVKQFNNGALFNFQINPVRVNELFVILKEEVEIDNRTFIYELTSMLNGTIEYAGLVYDIDKSVLTFNNEKVNLNPDSALGKFIAALIRAQGNKVTYTQLAKITGIHNAIYDDAEAHKDYGKMIQDYRFQLTAKFSEQNKQLLSDKIRSISKAGFQLR